MSVHTQVYVHMSIPYRHWKSGFFYYVFSVYLRMSVSGYEHVNTGAFKGQLLGCRLEHGRLKSILSSQQESWYARLITEPFLHPQD